MPEFYPDQGFKQGYPWIFYQRAAPEVLYANRRIKFRVSFNEQNQDIGIENRLHFKLAKYDIDGQFFGFEDLTDQLVICDLPSEDVQRVYKIGNTVNIKCDFDITRLVSTKLFDRLRNQNYFYELFLVDYDGSLVDIPALITNIQGLAGDRPNTSEDESKWILTRRFFLFESISGTREGDYPGGVPQTVQYASSMKLII